MPAVLKRNHYKTNLCELDIALMDDKIIALSFSDLDESYLGSLLKCPYEDIAVGSDENIITWLDSYFSGKNPGALPPLRLYATAFGNSVLKACMRIPYAENRSYAELAFMAGNSKAVRAAGTALAGNPLPLLIPCHRVIRSDGSPGKFGGGDALKIQLLNLEKGIL